MNPLNIEYLNFQLKNFKHRLLFIAMLIHLLQNQNYHFGYLKTPILYEHFYILNIDIEHVNIDFKSFLITLCYIINISYGLD